MYFPRARRRRWPAGNALRATAAVASASASASAAASAAATAAFAREGEQVIHDGKRFGRSVQCRVRHWEGPHAHRRAKSVAVTREAVLGEFLREEQSQHDSFPVSLFLMPH